MQIIANRHLRVRSVQAGSLKSALQCLSYITAAVNPAEWAPALRPFTLLLRYSTDARPKVRKRAQYGLVDVLAALQGSPALQGASDAVLNGQSTPTRLLAELTLELQSALCTKPVRLCLYQHWKCSLQNASSITTAADRKHITRFMWSNFVTKNGQQ